MLLMAPIPGSSYSHKNVRKFIYYSLNSDFSVELPDLQFNSIHIY
jgi:hypothetical protein